MRFDVIEGRSDVVVRALTCSTLDEAVGIVEKISRKSNVLITQVGDDHMDVLYCRCGEENKEN